MHTIDILPVGSECWQNIEPWRAAIAWKPSVADPAWIVHAQTPGGIQYSFKWHGRLLVRLMGWYIKRQWRKGQEARKAAGIE